MGIKETKELLDAIKVISVIGVKTFKDGVQISDLGALADIAKQFNVLAEGVKGIENIDDELKDLDQAEVVELVSKVYEIVNAIKAEL